MNVFTHTRDWLEREKLPYSAMPSTGSTNEVAKAEAFSLGEPLKVYFADQQTAGRGRGTHTWSNPAPGDALMATFSLNVGGAPQPITAPLTGLAVYNALNEVWSDLPLAVKAPNDILLNGDKICGLLIETVQMGQQHRLLIGLGLNVFSAPPNVAEASFLARSATVDPEKWHLFLKKLCVRLRWVAQGSQAAHLSDDERESLLRALNRNPRLPKHYVAVTPFGDLVTGEETISWRSL